MPHLRRVPSSALLALLAIFVAVFAAPAAATPPTALTATYTVASQVPTSAKTAGVNSFLTVTAKATFAGGITGDATGTERFLFRGDGSVALHLRSACLCSVAGRTGTLEFHADGGGAPGDVSGTIVGVGSDGLKGFHLNGTWSVTAPGVVTISATHHFDG